MTSPTSGSGPDAREPGGGPPEDSLAWQSPETSAGWNSPGGAAGWNSPGGAPANWGSPPPGAGWGPAPGMAPAAAPRPGPIPLRPLALGEILDGAFTVVRRNPRVTVGWSAVIVLLFQVVALGPVLLDGSFAEALNATNSPQSPFGSGPVLVRVWSIMISAASGGVLAAFLAVVVSEAVLGRSLTFGEVWQRVRPRLLAVLGVSLIAGLLPYLGLLLLVLPGIFLWGALALAPPALVLERLPVGAALRRSWRLATPSWWRVWGIRALSVLIAGAVSAILVVPAGIIGGIASIDSFSDSDTPPVAFVLVVALVGLVASILTQPFVAAVVVLIYIDRRMRAEALDVTLAQAAGAPGAAGSGTASAAAP